MLHSDKQTTVLIILDGWGHRTDTPDNAIAAAQTPVYDHLLKNSPNTLIQASSSFVGLPEGQMGNSEVGHMNIGAGRVIFQDLTRINNAIKEGSFSNNPVFSKALTDAVTQDKAIHILGLLSAGGVHSHEDHIMAMIDTAYAKGVRKIYVHAFLDGRDTAPKSAEASLKKVAEKLTTLNAGCIASVIGRYYAMDRDNRWDRIEMAYQLITEGQHAFTAPNAVSALKAAYDRGESDEFVKATSITTAGQPAIKVEENDTVIFMNFRADRARQLSQAFTDPDFKAFKRRNKPQYAHFIMLTEYAASMHAECAFPPTTIHNAIGEVVANTGKKQLRLAETEKYAHVTFFFNGGRETPFTGEDRHLINSPDVATYDLQPQMSAPEMTAYLVNAIKSKKYDLIVCNYANCDMVGHTGNFAATVKAAETIDKALNEITAALNETGGQCLITADHGNAEQMEDNQTGQPHTAHTSEPVPLIYFGPKNFSFKEGGRLCDLAPTVLSLMNIEQPEEMTGSCLI